MILSGSMASTSTPSLGLFVLMNLLNMTNNNKPRTIPPHSVPINDPTETEEQEVTGLAVLLWV